MKAEKDNAMDRCDLCEQVQVSKISKDTTPRVKCQVFKCQSIQRYHLKCQSNQSSGKIPCQNETNSGLTV